MIAIAGLMLMGFAAGWSGGLAAAPIICLPICAALVLVTATPDPDDRPVRVVLTGGGTGGHVYPALAIHRALEERGLVGETLYLGVRGRAEERLVPRAGLKLDFIPSAPVAGGSKLAMLEALAVVARGTVAAMAKLIRFRPRLIVATGGYVAAPAIVAAFFLKPFLRARIVVHEQNLVPGLLNKVGSLLADVVLVSFPESAYFIWSNRCVFTGYPVRGDYLLSEAGSGRQESRQRLGLPDDAFVVLVYGGSLGARSINRGIVDAIEELAGLEDSVFVHGIGLMQTPEYHALEETADRLARRLGSRFDRQALTATDHSGRCFYRGFEYIHDLVDYQRAADLVVCRAGAGSLAEIAALGKAALVIPKRGLPGDHQEINAIGLAERGAVEVLFERRDHATGQDYLDPQELVSALRELRFDARRRAALEAGSRCLSSDRVEERFVDAVRAVLAGQEVELISEIEEPTFVRFQRQFDPLVRHLDRSPPDGLYHRLYNIKVEEFLRSDRFLVLNKGIKLIGALKREDLYPFIAEHFGRFRGFLKRNGLAALRKADRFQPFFADLMARGLRDGYFEARREAVALFNRFSDEVARLDPPLREEIHRLILDLPKHRLESFEVKAEAIRAAVRILDEEEFLEWAGQFVFARRVGYRVALLDAIEVGLSRNLLVRRDRVRQLVKRMLITRSEFKPAFDRYLRVVELLEAER